MERYGTRETTGNITNVMVQWEGNLGKMEFWKSYPSFAPLGVEEFFADHELLAEEVEEAIAEWEDGGGLSF
jgi:hypothetical protein